jgi:mannose-1-phosphate guanylyltransferase
MTIFAILMPTPQPQLIEEIKVKFPADHLVLNDTQYLISTVSTAVELAAKLGIYDARNPAKPTTGFAVILATSSYYGRGPATVWEWMKTKLEAPPSG